MTSHTGIATNLMTLDDAQAQRRIDDEGCTDELSKSIRILDQLTAKLREKRAVTPRSLRRTQRLITIHQLHGFSYGHLHHGSSTASRTPARGCEPTIFRERRRESEGRSVQVRTQNQGRKREREMLS